MPVWPTVDAEFRARVAAAGAAPALQDPQGIRTYAELDGRVERLARAMARRGLRRGDRLAILSENRIEYVELFLAAARVGAIAACLNWRMAAPELRHCVRLVAPRLAFVSPRHAQTWQRLGAGEAMTFDGAFNALLAEPGADYDDPAAEDGLLILFTSGTTGNSKGALLSQRALVARDRILREDRGLGGTDTFIAWSPLFHMGAADPALATLMRGGKVIIMDGFDAAGLASIVAEEKIGHLTMVPGTVQPFLAAMKRLGRPARGVRVVGAMADLLPRAQLAELTALLGAPYCNTFGSTETGPAPASRGLVPPGEAPARLAKLQSSMCELRLVDEAGQDVPDGEPGEALVKSPALFSGYWGMPEATAAVLADGWYRMGDVLRRNPDGTLDFVDRRKYLIKSGGENIYPAELEQVLLALPQVAEAVVVRRLDSQWGEVPVAFVVCRDASFTEAAALAAFDGAIARYKRPREIRFVSMDEIPRNASGKVERTVLEQRAAGPD